MLPLTDARDDLDDTLPAHPLAHRRPEEQPARAGWARATALGAAELLVGVVAALVLVMLSRRILVDPMDRIGQVSGLAGIGLRYVALGLALLGAAVLALHLRGGRWFPVVVRLCCSAVAGLSSGFVGGGIVVALHGTGWGLAANRGDAGQIIEWVAGVQHGQGVPSYYPPLFIHVMADWADLTGSGAAAAMRTLQIVGTALFGPIAYLSWRLLLRPLWALAIAVPSALVLADPYKPYEPIVLVVLTPVLILLLGRLRRSATLGWRRLGVEGLAFGVSLGVLFLAYSGWYVWSAPGIAAAGLVVFPWRRGPLRGLALAGTTTVAFVAVSWSHLSGILLASSSLKDKYFYFDTSVEPAFIAMWRGSLPGNPGAWPPPGELAGVGLFTVVLLIGLGVAIWLGARRTVVISLTMLFAGSWLMRFWFAEHMYATQSVQLYPRTTQELIYCALLLVGFAVHYAVDRLRSRRPVPVRHSVGEEFRTFATPSRALLTPTTMRGAAALGVLAAMLGFGLFSGSATADKYMPSNDRSLGSLAWTAHTIP